MARFIIACIVLAGHYGLTAMAVEPAPIVHSGFIYNEPLPTPSCHASTILPTADGALAAWFGGKREGDDSVGIWLARFDGKAWSKPIEIATGQSDDGKRYPCWNPVLFQPAKGPAMLFYKVGPSPSKWWGMLITSEDGFKTCSKPTRLPEGILGPIKNKAIGLKDGTILCPSSTEHIGWRLHMEFTSDLGKTWSKTEPLDPAKNFGAIQPTILQLGEGKLRLLCRTRQGKIATAISSDNGKTWSDLSASDLPNPNSGIDAVTLVDGRHLLVFNNTPKGRSPLNLAISKDSENWKVALTLEDSPGEYSYPAIAQGADGKVHITYTFKRQKIKHVVIDPAGLNGN